MPSPQRHWVLHVGAQEQCPSNAMFTKVKNINNVQCAPPVVSIRSRCVQESKCVYIHGRTQHSLRLVRDYPSQAAVNTDKYSIRPVLPTALRELWQVQCFPPSCERPGVFSALWGAWVPAVHGLAAAPRELEGSDSQPGAFLTANSPLCALPAWRAAGDRGSE